MIVTRAYEFSRLWMAKGHTVTVVTTSAMLMPEDLKNAKGRFLKKLNLHGIEVYAFSIPYKQKMGMLGRCLSWSAFTLASTIVCLFVKKVEVIYARSTPLTTGITAMLIKRARNIPFVFEVTDQWPEIPMEIGIITNKMLAQILVRLESAIYQRCDSIIACSPGMATGVRNVLIKMKLKDKPITVIPNFSETDFYRPEVDGSEVRKKQGWNNKLVFLHAGTMGRVNGLGFVVDAAIKLKDHHAILFVLVGRGNERPALEKRVRQSGLRNVEILPAMPKRQLASMLAAADIGMVIVANYPILQDNSANKFFDALSAGKPVLLNYSGWQREILEENKAGLGCKLCNIDEFVEKILYLNSHRQELTTMGANARRLAEERFDRDMLANQALEVITSVNASPRIRRLKSPEVYPGKRVLDIALSLLAGLILLPIFVVVTAMVKLSSRGPAVFKQERAGRDGKPFMFYKFRTMRVEVNPFGPSPKSADDPRFTKTGRFLREYSLDELPQLFNVLKGDMSVVGPRPLYVSQIAEWNERQKKRLQVKPGLTGLAQVCGRGGLTVEEKLELDVKYVETKSLLLDLKIIMQTIGQIFRPKGIYEKRYSQKESTRGQLKQQANRTDSSLEQ
jgi:lipopolysaccharide/colanic/teichoic acid biosynthesis glycosyltransferase